MTNLHDSWKLLSYWKTQKEREGGDGRGSNTQWTITSFPKIKPCSHFVYSLAIKNEETQKKREWSKKQIKLNDAFFFALEQAD